MRRGCREEKAEEADVRVGIAIKGAFEIGNAVITIMRSEEEFQRGMAGSDR